MLVLGVKGPGKKPKLLYLLSRITLRVATYVRLEEIGFVFAVDVVLRYSMSAANKPVDLDNQRKTTI